MARRPDPHIAERMRAEAFFRRQERKLFTGVMTAMTAWLDDARTLLLGDTYLPPNLTAAADQPDFTNINASFETWRRGLNNHIEPVISETFGEAFAAHSRNADISPTHWQEHHMATVHDRLKIWPENAFEELRPELLEAMAQNEDYDAITDRIGRTLNIDAPSRRIRADISAIDAKLADPTTPTTEIAGLKGRRRTLWNQHDESLLDWQWKARRIARTEIHGAIQAGTWASAEATAQITGDKLYKAWLATSDERTRGEHVIADGQIVPISTSFSVAGYPMMYPGDPFAPAHLVVNCRCSMRILTESEVQDELQGMWGGRGVGPGNARLGPDITDDITVAIDRWKREQKGEVVGDNRPPGQVERDAKREAPDRLNPGWSEQDTVRPHEGNPVPIVDPEPDDPYAPLVINIGGDDELPDEPDIDTDIDLPDDDEDDTDFGPLEPTTVDGTDTHADIRARLDVQEFPEHLRERLQENGVTVEIADTIPQAPAGAFLNDDEVDDGRPWDTVGGVYLNFGDQGGVVVLTGNEHGSENMAFHELSHAVDDRYLHNRPLNVEWREQGARHLPESIRPAVQRPYRSRITRITDDPYLAWAHKIVFAEDRADNYYVRGSLGNERSGRDEWFAESLAAFLLGATAKLLEVSGGNKLVVDVLKWTFRRILKL